MATPEEPSLTWSRGFFVSLLVGAILASAGVTALLVNIFQRKTEERTPFVRLVEVGEDDVDPAKWKVNWPRQYDGYQRVDRRSGAQGVVLVRHRVAGGAGLQAAASGEGRSSTGGAVTGLKRPVTDSSATAR